ncbi:MAG: immunoglobulin domain-containing protein, partial [Verrucomicrobiae bacterium]|nr:immunoglobulin domain-containing protein [Verrucomicrobiae bacterium]
MNWTALGEGTRITGGWRLEDVSVPEDAILRARGLVIGSQYNAGNSWVAGYFGRPVILEQPSGGTFASSSTVSLTVRADGTGPLSYQWFKDGEALAEDAGHVGVQSPTLTLNDLWGPAGGEYSAVVTNPQGEVTSAVVTLTVTGDPRIASEPVSQVVNLGATATFEFGVEGTEPLTYQWWHDGVELPGANDASLVLENVQPAQAGEYRAVAANDYGEVTSQVVTLDVNQTVPELAFDPVIGGRVYALAVQSDDKILVGGNFTIVNGETRKNLARLLPDGTLDPEFNPGADSPVEAFGIQPDGGILVAGEFTTLAGEPRQRIARLGPDGALDPDFRVPVDNTIRALALQPDGRILIGGHFTLLDGEAHAQVGRLNPDGSVDDGFAAGVQSNGSYTPSVRTFAVQPDGRIVVAGYFSTLNGEPAGSIGRLTPDGSRDPSFAGSANSIVDCLTLQPDGRILVAGHFTVLNAQSSRSHVGRLNVDGSLDTSFQSSVTMNVMSLALQADGRILVGGVIYDSWSPASRIIRLESGGSLDPVVDPRADRDVYAIALQSDGRILAGGWFSEIAGVERGGLCRLSNTGPAVESIEYDDSVFWTRGGAAPELSRTTFEHTGDGITWTGLGEGIRISGGWALTPPTPVPGGNIHARGYLSGAQNNGSSWFVDTYSGPPLFLEQPEGQSAPKQTLVTFGTRVVGSGPLAYQWHHDGLPLEDGDRVSGSRTPVLTVGDLTGEESGEYTLVATNGLGETTSRIAVLSVLDPWIILQPESQTVNWGQRVDFETYAVGTGDLSYQWWKDGVEIPGANEPWLELSGLTAGDAGDYWVVATGPYGGTPSESATLDVVLEPSIVTHPASQIGNLGGQVSFVVGVQGEPPMTYAWYRNSETLNDE